MVRPLFSRLFSLSLTARLSRIYISALGALALLAISGQIVLQTHLWQQTDDAHVINLAGRQRMLSQKISKNALALTLARSAPERSRLRAEMRAALSQWERAQQGLQNGDREWHLSPAAAPLRPRFAAIDPPYQAMRRAARQLIDAPNPDALSEILKAEPLFLDGMDQLVNEYERQAHARVITLRHLESSLFCLTLLVLILEGFYFFRPAARLIKDSVAGREDALHSLHEQQQRMEDATEQLTEANTLFAQAAQRFQELFQGLPVACFCYDAQGRIIEWNRAFESLCWPEDGSPMQRTIWETICLPEDKPRIQNMIAQVFEGAAISDIEWMTHERSYLCSTFPLREPDGGIVGGICAKVDITARKHAEEAVTRHNQRLHSFYNTTSAPQISLARKINGLLTLGCAQFGTNCGLLTRQSGEVLHTSSSLDSLAPGTVLAIRQEGSQHNPFFCPVLPDMPTAFCVPVRVAGHNWGTLCFAHTHPTDFANADTEFLRLIAQWIGGELERAQAELATMESEERFRQAISVMQEGMMLTLRDGTTSLCNESAARILETSPEKLAARGLIVANWQVTREDGTPLCPEERPTKMAFQTGQAQRDRIMGVEKENGQQVWLLVNSMPLFHPDEPTPYAVATTFTDITERRHSEQQLQEKMSEIQDYSAALEFQTHELEKANAQLEDLATLDGLTSLKNHRAFQERLTGEIERADRYQQPLSMLILDVDHFKSYNDTYGHPAGDEVLKTVARLLREGTRETDFVARYGGEEFVVILPHTDAAGAVSMGERLRVAIVNAPWRQRPVTASFGVSTLRSPSDTGAILVAKADQALYLSKSSGRNRVSHASEIPALDTHEFLPVSGVT